MYVELGSHPVLLPLGIQAGLVTETSQVRPVSRAKTPLAVWAKVAYRHRRLQTSSESAQYAYVPSQEMTMRTRSAPIPPSSSSPF